VPATAAASDEPFVIGGRMSARRGDSGVAGAFTWTHDAHRDAIDLATPLGQTIAQLEGGARGVSVRLQDGRTETAATWRELTERAFGVVIPVDGLAAWVRGLPRAGAQATIERDATARVSLLRQDGWEVIYAYADDASRRPSRVTLSYPGTPPVEVRVVVDRRE
jgi:outer membrane lipoprotein LolB